MRLYGSTVVLKTAAYEEIRRVIVRVVINGMEEEVEGDLTVAHLAKQFGEGRKDSIVELNGRFIFPHRYAETHVEEGDRLEFIELAIGG